MSSSPPPPPPRRRSWSGHTKTLLEWVNLSVCSALALACVATLPLVAIASLLPLVGFVAVPVLVAVATCLFLLVPAVIRLAFGDYSAVLVPIRLLHPLQNLRLLVTTYRTLLDIRQSGLITSYLESLSNRLLHLGGGDGPSVRFHRFEQPRRGEEDQVRRGIVYVPANVELGLPAKRLDIYLPHQSSNDDLDDKENQPPVPVVILLEFASYRLAADTRSFPIPNLAHQIQSSLGEGGVGVVVPSLTAFTSAGGNETTIIERMVGETRECIKWVGENIARYGGDAGKVWVMGYGAGAHIASLTLVQSAVVASREAYLSQRAMIRARLAQQEGLVSVDAESVASPCPGIAAPADSEPALRAPPPAEKPTTSKRRERERSKTDSSSDKAEEAEEIDEDDAEDEIERLLRGSRSTRRFGTSSLLGEQQQQQQHHHRRQVSWSDVPVPAHEHIPLSPLPPLDYHPTVPGGAVESADDEIEISDGVRSCRLFTLASLEEDDEVYDPVGVASNEQLPSADPAKVFATEPEFACASSTAATAGAADNMPRSLASFEIPPRSSISSSSSNTKKAGKGAFHKGGGGKGVGLGKQVEIRGMILVEGTYDIVKQSKWEHDCGIEEVQTGPLRPRTALTNPIYAAVSSLTRLCVAPQRDYLHACPSHLLYAASPLLSHVPSHDTTAATPPAPLSRRFLPPNVLLIHGGADHLSPFSPAVLFRNLLLGVGLESDHVDVKLYRHLTAMGALAALTGETEYTSILFDEIADVLDADEGNSG